MISRHRLPRLFWAAISLITLRFSHCSIFLRGGLRGWLAVFPGWFTVVWVYQRVLSAGWVSRAVVIYALYYHFRPTLFPLALEIGLAELALEACQKQDLPDPTLDALLEGQPPDGTLKSVVWDQWKTRGTQIGAVCTHGHVTGLRGARPMYPCTLSIKPP